MSSRPLKPAAVYLRVSTSRQETGNQFEQIEEFARLKGYDVVARYEDTESGASNRRPAFQRLMRDAALSIHIGPRGRIRNWRTLLFWSLDRFSREGVFPTLQYLQQLDQNGIDFVSITETYLDTTGPFRGVLIALLAALAETERKRIGERVRAGLDRAKQRGAVLGRPRRELPTAKELQAEREAEKLSLAALAKKHRVSVNTLCRRFVEDDEV